METQFPNKWAILIGINEYEKVKPLKYCQNDIVELHKTLVEFLEFREEHILEFHEGADLKPERDTIIHNLGELRERRKIGQDDLLIFYFSGHGIRWDNKDYLLPIKASPHSLRLTGIMVEDLVEELEGIKCKNLIMFIDACREAIGGEKGGILSIGEDSKNVVSRSGIVTFFSCDPKDQSYEIDDLKHASFTYCILEAIKKGNCKTAADLDRYLRENVPLINSKFGKPQQLPYAIIQPAEKEGLPIFFSRIQRQQKDPSLDALIEKLTTLYVNEQLEAYYYKRADDVIRQSQEGSSDQRKLRMIRDLCEDRLSPQLFISAWNLMEKSRLGEPSIQTQLGPIK